MNPRRAIAVVSALIVISAFILYKIHIYNQTATLIDATSEGNVEEMMRLIASHTCINCRAADGTTPLIEASKRGDLKSITLLLASGADVDFKSSSGLTPLLWAAFYDRLAAVELLLSKNARFDVPDVDRVSFQKRLESLSDIELTKVVTNSLKEEGDLISARPNQLHFLLSRIREILYSHFHENGSRCESEGRIGKIHFNRSYRRSG